MKRRLIQVVLLLCLMALTCAAAQAAESEDEPTSGFQNVVKEQAYQQAINLNPKTDAGASVEPNDDGKYPGAAKMEFAYTQAQAGKEYALFVLTDENPPTADNIAYIDQKTADANGAVTFTIYPKRVAETVTGVDYTVCLSSDADASAGTAMPYTPVASFSYYAAATVMLGDVNGNGQVQANDARAALQIASRVITPTAAQLAAADLNGDGQVLANEARRILLYASRQIPSLP